MASEPAVVLGAGGRAGDRSRVPGPDGSQAWRWIGWFGLVLALAGGSDFVLTWIPLDFGTPEWEFGTIAASFSGLPLVTMGLAAMLASAVARGVRWQVVGLGVVLIGGAVLLLAALVVFLLVIPIALAAVEGVAKVGIVKAIVRTLLLGVLFSTGYAVAGLGALRTKHRPD